MGEYDGYDLFTEQIKAYQSMEKSNKEAYEMDVDKAEHDKEYEIELTKKILLLREDGVQASIVERVAKGDPDIAELKFQANICEAKSRAAKENINIKKKLFDSIEATKKRELG